MIGFIFCFDMGMVFVYLCEWMLYGRGEPIYVSLSVMVMRVFLFLFLLLLVGMFNCKNVFFFQLCNQLPNIFVS